MSEAKVQALPLPAWETDPTGYVLAVADLREKRATSVPRGTWRIEGQVYDRGEEDLMLVHDDLPGEFDSDTIARFIETRAAAAHLAAEASPAHALAEVALWRYLADWPHDDLCSYGPPPCECTSGQLLTRAVAACRAYAGDVS